LEANPFKKSDFRYYRDWEASLIKFLAKEARTPDLRNWLELSAAEPDVKTAAAFSALLLSDLLETRSDFRERSRTMYRFYETLRRPENETEAFEQWLRSGWLNVARVADMLGNELRH
jgi:hypothetical protein